MRTCTQKTVTWTPAGPAVDPTERRFSIGDRVLWGTGARTYEGTIKGLPEPGNPTYHIQRDNGNVLSLKADTLTLVKTATPDPATLAAAIVKVSDGMTALLKSGLNREAIIVLLKHSTGLSMRDIGKVLDGLADLKRQYVS